VLKHSPASVPAISIQDRFKGPEIEQLHLLAPLEKAVETVAPDSVSEVERGPGHGGHWDRLKCRHVLVD
jgi:hypothetical protein